MKRSFYWILAISFVVSMAMACDESEPDDSDDEPSSEQLEADLALDEDEEDRGDAEALAEDIESALRLTIQGQNEMSQVLCPCSYRDLGFTSSEQCLAAVLVSDEETEGTMSCFMGALSDVEEPSEAALNGIQCMGDLYVESMNCINDVVAEFGDDCSEELINAIQKCEAESEHIQADSCYDMSVTDGNHFEIWFDGLVNASKSCLMMLEE